VVKEFTFAGHTVPAGLPMFLAIAGGHRLPTIFAQPDLFDPQRFDPPREEDKRHPYSLVTFGGGSRICIGEGFAWMEGVLLLAALGQKWRFVREDPRPVEPQPLITLRPRGGIAMRLEFRDARRQSPVR